MTARTEGMWLPDAGYDSSVVQGVVDGHVERIGMWAKWAPIAGDHLYLYGTDAAEGALRVQVVVLDVSTAEDDGVRVVNGQLVVRVRPWRCTAIGCTRPLHPNTSWDESQPVCSLDAAIRRGEAQVAQRSAAIGKQRASRTTARHGT